MSLFGKLMLVAQLVLSVCFLALAGAVFSQQETWKDKHAAVQDDLTAMTQKYELAEAAKDEAGAERDRLVGTATEERDRFKGQLDNLRQSLDDAIAAKNAAEANLARQEALANVNSTEAVFRKDEAITKSTVNENLTRRLDETNTRLSEAQDRLFSTELQLTQVRQQYERTAEQLVAMRRQASVQGVDGGGIDIANRVEPPPEVDGFIVDTRKNNRGNVELVEITIGSDDGVQKGHTLQVYRSGDGQKSSDYLGDIELVDVSSDSAIGRVVIASKSGIIQEGDRVTKL